MLTNRLISNIKYLNKWNNLLTSSCLVPISCKNKVIPFQRPLQMVSPSARLISGSSVCNKYNKHSKDEDSESDDDNDPDLKDERDSKIVKTKVNSLRTDLLLKAGLSMARNKIEVIFYESKIRVNGKKIAKKSAQLEVGDEIDVIKGFSNVNPSHLLISRVTIVSAKEKEDAILVHLRRYKTMLIENYPGMNAYKSSETAHT